MLGFGLARFIIMAKIYAWVTSTGVVCCLLFVASDSSLETSCAVILSMKI